MSDNKELKRLERRAKSYLVSKDIPPDRMKLLRTIMKNEALDPFERYNTIINLLHKCPDKTPPIDSESSIKSFSSKREKEDNKKSDKLPVSEPLIVNGPTVTSLYINDIYAKHRHLKLFKRRYLVHRNNRFGFGLRKRLIPTKLLLKVMQDVAELQEQVLSRINTILMAILDSDSNQEPLYFNYLRKVRKWLMIQPFTTISYEAAKWMEQQHFEREIKSYAVQYFSFMKMSVEEREEVILLVENTLRNFEGLVKEEILEQDTDVIRREKEKRNLEREKDIYGYMILLRSFLANDSFDNNRIDGMLNQRYDIPRFQDLLVMIITALVYQRPFTQEELQAYYEVAQPRVSKTVWDYSEDYLKQVGKDPESQKQRSAEHLRKRLAEYETLDKLLKQNDQGKTLLFNAAMIQWKNADKRRSDPAEIYTQNYFSFLDGIVNYFGNTFVPLMDGSTIYFKDLKGKEIEGQLFTNIAFESELTSLNSIISEMHFFRTNNPTLAISRSEVKSIMGGKISSMTDVRGFIITIGDFFYKIAKRFEDYFDLHRLWLESHNISEYILSPGDTYTPDDLVKNSYDTGRAFPYNNCIIIGFEKPSLLSKSMHNKNVIEEHPFDGIIPAIIGFCYQAAYDCLNERLNADLENRKDLMSKIRSITL